MPPQKQREYPRLTGISDQNVKESLRLLWDRIHDGSEAHNTNVIQLAKANAMIDAQTLAIARLTKQMTSVLAGGGISTASTVGGGGSGGASGGSGSGTPGGGGGGTGGGGGGGDNQDTFPNQQGVVQQAIDDLTAALIDLSGYCGCFQITKLVAWRLAASQPNVGIASAKPTSENNCDGYTTDVIVYKQDGSNNLVVYDIATDSGGPSHNAVWSFAGTMALDRWNAPIPPAI